MPGRRPVKKGSFDSHFDEVVKHFPHEKPDTQPDGGKDSGKPTDASVHDRLFESAWSKARGHDYGRLA